MELPQIRDATQEDLTAGKACQYCTHWLQYPRSYGEGVCILGGVQMPPRWSHADQVCDGFKATMP